LLFEFFGLSADDPDKMFVIVQAVFLAPLEFLDGRHKSYHIVEMVRELLMTHCKIFERGRFGAELAHGFVVVEMIVRVGLVSRKFLDVLKVPVELCYAVFVQFEFFLELGDALLLVEVVKFELV
jgi:hypothetical protein